MGGNVFDIAQPIEKKHIQPTLENFYNILKQIFPKAGPLIDTITPVGSVEKKPQSGDLDLVMDEKAISTENLDKWDLTPKEVQKVQAEITAKARTASPAQTYRRAVLTLLMEKIGNTIPTDPKSLIRGMMFFAIPQIDENGKELGSYVQTDLNFGKQDWLSFSYFSDEYGEEDLKKGIKGLHRTQLLAAMFSAIGYTFDHSYGVKSKETGELVSDNPQTSLDILNQEYGTSLTIDLVKNVHTLFKHIQDTLSDSQLEKVLKSYLKRLDQAKAPIPAQVQQYLQNRNLNENNGQIVGLYGGGFKPPHQGHFNNALTLAREVDKLIIFIGHIVRSGEVITPEQSKQIWEIYAKYLPTEVDIQIAPVSPFKSIYEWLKANRDLADQAIIGQGPEKEEEQRFKSVKNNPEKYGKPTIKLFDITKDDSEDKLSGTNIRTNVEYFRSGKWIPSQVSNEDVKTILQILKVEEKDIKEIMEKELNRVLDEMFAPAPKPKKKVKEARTGLPVEPLTATPSETRNKLVYLYNRLRNIVYEPDFKIDFRQNQIVISPKNQPDTDFDYNPFMASLLEYMIDQGMNITPLPEVKIRKDLAESVDFFGKTAYYDPGKKEVILYVMGRHPKDVMRSFSHEMIHHMQNLENRLQNISTQNVNEDDYLMKIEEEAMLLGNKHFRVWEDIVKNNG